MMVTWLKFLRSQEFSSDELEAPQVDLPSKVPDAEEIIEAST